MSVAPRFLPWLRTGLASQITEPAVDGLATRDHANAVAAVRVRASGPAAETVATIPAVELQLAGPGNVIALDPAQVVRCDPPPGCLDAEPNKLPQIEFAAPDLPWRFTPAAPDDDRLQPWLALVVVEERDGVWLEPAGSGRLAVLHVDDADAELPDLAQCWAWAHVHAEHDLAAGIDAALMEAPEVFRSRLLCPRRLIPDRWWLACVVPTIQAGVRTGLGGAAADGAGHAWIPGQRDVELPAYYSWRFRTGESGDFESLVRRLRPRELPPGVGRRDLDLSEPGGGLPNAPGLLLTYEGALRSPSGEARPWPERHRKAFKEALRTSVNVALDRSSEAAPYDALVDDPVVGPPAYAATQAGRREVPVPARGKTDWFEALNTEPYPRSVSGLGGEVVRRDQEQLMAAAWRHAAGLRDANRLLSRARTSWELARRRTDGLALLDDAHLIQFAAPAGGRLAHAVHGTVRGALAASALPPGLVSATYRRLTRSVPGFAAAASSLEPLTAAALGDPVGFVGTWADVVPPAGADLGDKDEPDDDPRLKLVGRRAPKPSAKRAELLRGRRAELEGSLDRSRLADSLGRARLVTTLPPAHVDRDLIEPYGGAVVPLVGLATTTRSALDGAAAIARMVEGTVTGLAAGRPHPVPPGLSARPRFTTPMYERLRALSVEYLVPGLGDVPSDTLGLLEVNRPFVESFLAGLNHELGREFAWREYPAKLTATWALRFWDSGPDGPDDILPIDAWKPGLRLGDHQPAGEATASLVLLIRGGLPRRYPDMRVYAVEADWDDGARREAAEGEVRLPIIAGALDQETAFYGFALTEDEARGSTNTSAHPGWFFVLEERPGAVRFGLDSSKPRFRGKAPSGWASLSWGHLAGADDPLPTFIDTSRPTWLVDAGELRGNGGPDAWGDDAAAMARITLQRPVRMLTHADAMLPDAP